MKTIALMTSALLALPAIAAEQDPARCESLRQEVKRIDVQALKRSSTSLQERRRVAVSEMYDLRCSRAGFK